MRLAVVTVFLAAAASALADGDGVVNSQDFDGFLSAHFAGC
jgi:hypothetical protein